MILEQYCPETSGLSQGHKGFRWRVCDLCPKRGSPIEEKFHACRLPTEIGQAGQTVPPDPDLTGAGDTVKQG